ncbi:MAG TPA: hypothetical protein VLX30_07580 [Burkholderiales bacterium]|nr:hypothetical protein [Burkholderiales bacterium]
MCYEYDIAYMQRRAEEARRAMKEAEEKSKQIRQPAAAPAKPAKEHSGAGEPVPA